MTLENTIHKFNTGKNIKIVAFGDSLTYGWMVEKGYLDYLEAVLSNAYPENKIQIINRGIPGDTAEDGLLRLKEHVIMAEPDLVLVQFALNDAFSGHTPEKFRKNILAIISAIIEQTSADILIVTSSALKGADEGIIEAYYDMLRRISEEKEIPIAAVHEYWKQKMTEGVKFQTLVQDDGVHPTEEGYRLMAQAVFQAMK